MIDGPAVSAYNSVAFSMTGATSTKILFQTEEFDTNNNFSNSTFTPTVAGYYQVNATFNCGSQSRGYASIYKNGSEYKRGTQYSAGSAIILGASVSALVYLNGTTDFVEIYGFVQSTVNTNASSTLTWVQINLVRGA
jgi:hypothetical protein